MGAIGSMMLQLCHMAYAANIIVIEPDESKKVMALKLGAALFVNPLKENTMEVLKDAGIKNVDRVMECVGLKSTIELALNVAGKCATVVLFGLGDPEIKIKGES
jgi:threonine dehydrogenase-like Zn-dependent dehydrogenase